MSIAFANQHLAAWDARLAESANYARNTVCKLPADVLALRPSWGGWSIGEIFEHLCLTDGSYEAPLRALIRDAKARNEVLQSHEWRPSIAGRLLLWAINPANTRKQQAPPVWRPGFTPRAEVVDAWLAQVDRTRALMRDADGLELRRLKLSSPAARIIRLNMGDAFALAATHSARHMNQVRRTLADVVGTRS